MLGMSATEMLRTCVDKMFSMIDVGTCVASMLWMCVANMLWICVAKMRACMWLRCWDVCGQDVDVSC
jgi:hypothetical protein